MAKGAPVGIHGLRNGFARRSGVGRCLAVVAFTTLFALCSLLCFSVALASDEEIRNIYRAFPLRVIDGDTFIARIEIWSGIFITPQIRLRDVDAPELPPNSRCANEARMAKKAKDRLRVLIGKGVILRDVARRNDRYGRVLTDVIIDRPLRGSKGSLVGRSVTKVLLREGMVLAYAGGERAKSRWCS